MKILVVDDDEATREMIKSFLEPYGTCDTAEDGDQCLSKVREALRDGKKYDLILLDIVMPNLDGHQALRWIREVEQDAGLMIGDGAKIIMTTMRDGSKDIMQAFKEACDSYVLKPVRKDALLKEMKKLGLVPS